jgi:putative heme-binding domain-containing protein
LLGGFDETLAAKLLTHANPAVRMWTVRPIGDAGHVTSDLAELLAGLAHIETDPEVRSQLACSARRLPTEACLSIAEALCDHSEDVDDPYMPHLIWWAFESQAHARDAVLDLFRTPEFWQQPLVRETLLERVMRRYASGGRADLEICAQLLELSPDEAATDRLLAGFEAGLKGRSLSELPPRLVQALIAAGGGSVSLRVRQGDAAAIEEALSALASSDADLAQRIEYAQLFGEVIHPAAQSRLLHIVDGSEEGPLVAAALAALQSYDEERIAAAVLGRLANWPDDLRTSGIALVASRPAWARQLLEAIEARRVVVSIPADVLDRVAMHGDEQISKLIGRLWPERGAASTAVLAEALARTTTALETGDADPYRGHLQFTESCAKCHVLFREGGRIGPDLTPYQREDSPRMLLHVVNPGIEIREGFETWIVSTDDGRIVSGFLFDQDANVIVLRGADGQNITVPRATVEEMTKSPTSLMPTGLLDELSEQEIRDLFAYLRLSQPLNE